MKIFLRGLTAVGITIGSIVLVIVCMILIARWLKIQEIKITTPNGIQENSYINIGGIEQYIQIRGKDKNNPVIIFLHGGPGNTIAHLSYYYQPELEAQYTFVNWDQRGSGKTYYRNNDLDVESHLSTEILLEDLDELVDYAREKFNQDQVIVMGHSWGTLLGSKYVLVYPEKVMAYIGIGQVVSLKEGYLYSSNEALEKARTKGDSEVVNKLEEAIENFSKTNTIDAFDFNNFIKMQQYTMKYNAYEGEMSSLKMLWMMVTSPELSWADIKWFFKTSNPSNLITLQGPLLADCFFGLHLYEFGNQYEVPMHYITGAYDVSTPIELVESYYETMVAPTKSITRIPDTGHLIFFDNPKLFSSVVEDILTQQVSHSID